MREKAYHCQVDQNLSSMNIGNQLLKFSFILFLGQLISCTPALNIDDDELAEVIEMEKAPCFDQCPVFKLTLYENGMIKFEGEDFVDREGIWTNRMEHQ